MGDVRLREDQIADLAFLMTNERAGLLNDPGTGKTPTVCVLQWWLWIEHGMGTVWIMPKSLLGKNCQELLRFTPFQPDDVVIVDGDQKKVGKALKSGAKIFLMGFDRFALCWRDLPDHVQSVIVDEWHKGFKSHTSRRTKALFQFARRRMKRFVFMTGTLISGELSSTYPAVKLLDPRYYPNFNAFLNYHALLDDFGKPIVWRNHQRLAEILRRHCVRRTFKDIFGDQEVVYIPEVCYMSEAHREQFEKFREEAFLELEKFIIDGTVPGVGFIRGRQIQEIPNEFPDLRDVDEKGDLLPNHRTVDMIPGELAAKEERFLVHLEDHLRTGEPFVVFSALRRQQRRLYKHVLDAGIPAALMDSGTSSMERTEIDERFRRGEIQALVCSPQIADVGFNWQYWGPDQKEVCHTLLVTIDFLDTSVTQLVRRFIRGHRQAPLRVTVFEYEDSLDQRIFDILYRKSIEAHKVDPTREIVRLGVRFTETEQ